MIEGEVNLNIPVNQSEEHREGIVRRDVMPRFSCVADNYSAFSVLHGAPLIPCGTSLAERHWSRDDCTDTDNDDEEAFAFVRPLKRPRIVAAGVVGPRVNNGAIRIGGEICEPKSVAVPAPREVKPIVWEPGQQFALDGVVPRGLSAIEKYAESLHPVLMDANTKDDLQRVDSIPWRRFNNARKYVMSLGLVSRREWLRYCRLGVRPVDIPSSPQTVYRSCGWRSWGHWLGIGKHSQRDHVWMSFEECRVYARSLKLKGYEQWKS